MKRISRESQINPLGVGVGVGVGVGAEIRGFFSIMHVKEKVVLILLMFDVTAMHKPMGAH